MEGFEEQEMSLARQWGRFIHWPSRIRIKVSSWGEIVSQRAYDPKDHNILMRAMHNHRRLLHENMLTRYVAANSLLWRYSYPHLLQNDCVLITRLGTPDSQALMESLI